ncbi:helix-turn-helix transcriptional regulator [Gallibacterium melopsittaci]|uniref:Helix-turn-helix transcriptional regulator n=1 Tax=Gallibacterium melopsittaci TaxID=516063 RepID=A0ABV6HVM3_9PAST
MVQYIDSHIDNVSLKNLSKQFHYHPNYISNLLAKTLNKTFSGIVLEQRIQRAVALLQGSTLPVSEIADLLGYSNSSNFYKAFREYFQMSPREWQMRQDKRTDRF